MDESRPTSKDLVKVKNHKMSLHATWYDVSSSKPNTLRILDGIVIFAGKLEHAVVFGGFPRMGSSILPQMGLTRYVYLLHDITALPSGRSYNSAKGMNFHSHNRKGYA